MFSGFFTGGNMRKVFLDFRHIIRGSFANAQDDSHICSLKVVVGESGLCPLSPTTTPSKKEDCHSERSEEPRHALRDELTEGNPLSPVGDEPSHLNN